MRGSLLLFFNIFILFCSYLKASDSLNVFQKIPENKVAKIPFNENIQKTTSYPTSATTIEYINLQETGFFPKPIKGFTSWLPATEWQNALLCGNGEMGAMVFGNPHSETIIINHAEIYLPTTPPVKPINQSSRLKEINSLLLNDKYTEAAKIPVEQSEIEGYNGMKWSDPYIHAFNIKLQMPAENIEKFERSVNYETGEAIVSWKQDGNYYQRKTFASRADSLVIIQITGTAKINCSIEFKRPHVEWNQWDYINENIENIDISADENYLLYKTNFKKTWDGSLKGFEGLGKVVAKNGKTETFGKEIKITDADEVLIFIKVKPFYEKNISNEKYIKEVFNSLPEDYNILLANQIKVHGELFNRVSLNLNGTEEDYNLTSEVMMLQAKNLFSPAFVEKQFYAARYNILSATGINPPNLQGIWSGFWTPPWSSDYTHDGNLPVAISSFMCSNMSELMNSFFNYHEKMLPYYRENAKRLFGCNGIVIPSHTSTNGYNVHFNETWCLTFWYAAAGWAASFFYDYFLYTGDIDFLQKRAYPFMKEVALFYEDFLKKGDHGKLLFIPSYSPENTPANSNSQACINATMDVMIAKQVLKNCIASGKLLNENETKLEKWKEMLNNMPEYEVNENGGFREWLWKDLSENHKHRHLSHLYTMYDLIDKEIESDSVLLEGVKKVVEEKMKVRRKDDGGIMVFGMVQLAWVAANLGNSEMVSDIIHWLSAQYWSNSLATYHDPNGLFNMDLSGGFQTVIIKSLVYSEKGYIHLLPAVPKEFKSGSINGIKLRQQIEMKEMKWTENSVEIILNSEINQKVKIQYNNNIKEVDLPANKDFVFKY